jgi:hypothetical protein
MNTPDFQTLAKELGNELAALGINDWRHRIEQATDGRGTAIDWVESIRKTLRELLAAKLPLPDATREKASKLFREMGNFLRAS